MRLEPYWTVGFKEGDKWVGVLSFETRKEARKFVREMNFWKHTGSDWEIRGNQRSLMGDLCGGFVWGHVAAELEEAMTDDSDSE